jgi:hypothetical protein
MSRRDIRHRRIPGWILLAALAVGASAFAASAFADPGEDPVQAPVELDRRPGKGEQCLVCGAAIEGLEIVEVRYKGRTFHVAAKMLGEFDADPDAYFQKLQARSALFDERSMEGRHASRGWLYAGAYVLIGLVFAALCGYLAISRTLAPLPWFFAGLAGNVAALAVLLAAPRGDPAAAPAGVPAGLAKVPATHASVPCPSCGASNHPAASACSGCGAALAPAFEPETARV